MRDKDLTNTDLSDSNLRGVDLTGADLTGCNLRNTKLQHASLENAILTDVKNLTLQQLGGANLHNIQSANFVSIDSSAQVDEALKNVSKLCLTTVSLCIFAIVVLMASKDSDIIFNTNETVLPLLNIKISTQGFFVIMPAIIVVTNITLHFHLLRAWETMLDLPAIYPDGRTIERKVNPLLLNSIVFIHWPRLKDKLPPFTYPQVWLSTFTLYWLPPIVLCAIWERYLVKQSIYIVIWHLLLLLLTILMSRILRHLFRCSLNDLSVQEVLCNRRNWFEYAGFIAVPCGLFIIYQVVLQLPYDYKKEADGKKSPKNMIIAHLSEIHKPGSDLRDTDLSEADLHDAYLHDADLRRSVLTNALLRSADLSKSNLGGSHLEQAILIRAKLNEADLKNAHLNGAKLQEADLRGTDLSYADLTRADLSGAKLTGANLTKTDLTNAILTGANLKGAKYAKGWYATKWPTGFNPLKQGAILIPDDKP